MANKKTAVVYTTSSTLLPILDIPIKARQVELCGQIKATLEVLKPGQSFKLPKNNAERVRAKIKQLRKTGTKATFGIRTKGKLIHVGRTA